MLPTRKTCRTSANVIEYIAGHSGFLDDHQRSSVGRLVCGTGFTSDFRLSDPVAVALPYYRLVSDAHFNDVRILGGGHARAQLAGVPSDESLHYMFCLPMKTSLISYVARKGASPAVDWDRINTCLNGQPQKRETRQTKTRYHRLQVDSSQSARLHTTVFRG